MDPVPDSAAIDSRTGFQAALLAGLLAAGRAGAREIVLVDEDFADWPLNTVATMEAIAGWAAPHRRMTLLAADFSIVERQHPRWIAWRRLHAHLVDCRINEDVAASDLPCALLVPGCVLVELFDRTRFRGRVTLGGGVHEVAMRERVDALLQRSAPALPPTTLGL